MSLNADNKETYTDYGICPECKSKLIPSWYTEKEYEDIQGFMIPTGRSKIACNYLFCDKCGHKEIVDNTFDGEWF